MKAVVVDPRSSGRLALRDVDAPVPGPQEAVVRVEAISLNRGEVRAAQSAEAGWRPGWDLAGIVERGAADGSGPRPGARVVGMVRSRAWAEFVTVPTRALAEIPSTIPFAHAATLPVAGLTALHAVQRGGSLLGRIVLVTGASGGVGHLACQLARHAGGRVVGMVRQPRHARLPPEAGAAQVIVSEDGEAAREAGPYHLIVEATGGHVLGTVLSMLAPEGTCVSFGASAGNEATIDVGRFFRTGGLTLYGLAVFHEVRREPAGMGLERLLRLMTDGHLRPHIAVEARWTEIGDVAERLIDRGFPGKAVLRIGA